MNNVQINDQVRIDDAINMAIGMLREQEVVPVSPGKMIKGEVGCCTAAAIASAGYRL